MIKFSKDFLQDRILACWVGKNIGGTIGTPYEGKQELFDVKGFAVKPGEPLPNDDLDLQLVWLRAMDELGPENVNANTLGEYWLSYIGPHWNEYGNGKANLRRGFFPPLSGELNNEAWKHSNGAWIRTEIWACLYPLQVEKAIRYAFTDACVDHGYGEGSNAALFIAAMESAAFAVSDIQTLLQIGLSKIPETCRVARSVRIAMDAYRQGADWKEARSRLIDDSADLGWFQAPANIGFVVTGLLYGEGDFKQSLLTAVNCGDDTDCTGATVGALLGIKDGMAGIPEDWKSYLGDTIETCCTLYGHGRFPQTCTELTRSVMNLLPVTLRTRNIDQYNGADPVELGDENDFSALSPEDMMGRTFSDQLAARKPYSFMAENCCTSAWVELDSEPVITPEGTLSGSITLRSPLIPEPKYYELRWLLPEGWRAEGRRNLYVNHNHAWQTQLTDGSFTIHAGETVLPQQRIVLEITTVGRPTPLYVPITILR